MLGAAALPRKVDRLGRMKELVARVSGDLSSLEKQVEQTDVTFGAGAVIQLASLVLKNLLLLFTKHQKGVLSVELNRLGERCEMFQSWQLPFTA